MKAEKRKARKNVNTRADLQFHIQQPYYNLMLCISIVCEVPDTTTKKVNLEINQYENQPEDSNKAAIKTTALMTSSTLA